MLTNIIPVSFMYWGLKVKNSYTTQNSLNVQNGHTYKLSNTKYMAMKLILPGYNRFRIWHYELGLESHMTTAQGL